MNPITSTSAAASDTSSPMLPINLAHGGVVDLQDLDLMINGYIRRLPPVPPLTLPIEQHQMGIQSIEDCPDEQLRHWIYEIQQVAPNVLQRNKRQCLITVPLVTHSKVHYIGCSLGLLEIEWGEGFSGEHTIPQSAKAWCWSIRAIEEGIGWQDLVTMWAIAQFYSIAPSKVSLSVICLDRSGPAAVLELQHNTTWHQLTQDWLKQVLQGQPGPHPALVDETDVLPEDSLDDLLDFDAMPEVAFDGIEQPAAW